MKNIIKLLCLAVSFIGVTLNARGQQAYFIDGYHGGIWGHYPDWNTRFMVDMLKKYPYWKINLEIEPETWDRAAKIDPQAFAEFKALMANQSVNQRIEYVNPAYAQSYMYNIDGESIIRQLGYGIKKLQAAFPGIQFNTYSSEEPCFTNALPGILRSYGFKYASLKNPNTCFGGYTTAFGGELVNWIGPDGSSILTVPRYAIERLEPKSTWQTIGWNNNADYVDAALKYGIKHPLGMTLQDAGWKGGPFLDKNNPATQKQYTTWRNYFERIAKGEKATDWRVSQEDILVSLVWGSQVTQQIAQRVRAAENKILQAEKLSAIAGLIGSKKQTANFDDAWRTLMLAQHHDCWIVPYNGDKGDTWADKVKGWTANTIRQSDSINKESLKKMSGSGLTGKVITVFNTCARARQQIVSVAVPAGLNADSVIINDDQGREVATQFNGDSVLFIAHAPAFGYSTYRFVKGKPKTVAGVKVLSLPGGSYTLESDIYVITIDAKKGGNITRLYDKRYKRDLVDARNANGFNALRGNFYEDGGFKTTSNSEAKISVIEQGAVRATLLIKTNIAGTEVSQRVSITMGYPLIDMHLGINWQKDVKVGEYVNKANYKWTDYKKPFYNDSNKLLAVFPLALKDQKIYKNAPFEVEKSKLNNTFFNSWDSIKNNIILNWVDVMAADGSYGVALFTDHTTSYTHGNNFPLGLVVQYSGMGLWGRDYFTNGPTGIHYALLPHAGNWKKAGVWSASAGWNEPLLASVSNTGPLQASKTLIDAGNNGLTISSVVDDGKELLIRFFNAEGTSGRKIINLNFAFKKARLVELNGNIKQELKPKQLKNGTSQVEFMMPEFSFRTLRLLR
ncbi:glycosyl hydrolase [Mucilaginibacter sp. UR6-1]|uniref:glycoside hydrolase family 38 C-terminal domain-containing protein n=1 Tax=Mucilaginibacter sp. UR6-1 TaxID=1435643 RepID=UPI001E4ED9D2|nr:glycoside hydrolase family 38 C-terminal domain-containing protein [Mucilaginibacter sp. UR6-1]MCC8409290.1 glycosyl hydrolase [Mucilaginibacter sp. UR6-1]